MAGLNTGGQRFAGDDGAADPHIAAVLAAYGAGRDSEQAALTALAGARLLVPLVERPASDGHAEQAHPEEAHPDLAGPDPAGPDLAGPDPANTGGCDHQMAREMAFPTLIGRDGRPALLAFTSLAALVAWRPDARPVPTPAGQVWRTAVADTGAVVIDVAGPVPVAVDGFRLAALAAGEPPPAPHHDPDVRAEVAAALADLPAGALPAGAGAVATSAVATGAVVTGAELAAGPDGTDLAVTLLIRLGRPAPTQPTSGQQAGTQQAGTQQAATQQAGTQQAGTQQAGTQQAGTQQAGTQQAVQWAAEAIAARLASRLRRGIQFSATLAPAATPASAPSRARG